MKDFSELKVGDECFIRARLRGVEKSAMRFDTIDENGEMLIDFSFSLVNSEYNSILTAEDLQQEGNPTHNEEAEENKPKYDPCRLFRKGDKVRVVECKGRNCSGLELGLTGEISLEEGEDDPIHGVGVDFDNGNEVYVDPAYLELVTPVEERMPYKVWDTTFSFNVGVEDSKAVFYYGSDMSTCPYTKEQAKAAAEAECERLNAEYRKEQRNVID